MVKNPRIKNPSDSKGAEAFQRMMEDQKVIRAHLKKGGKLTDLTDKFKFLDPQSFYKAD